MSFDVRNAQQRLARDGRFQRGHADLGYFARAILIFTMFIGRVGPLTLTLAVASGQAKKSDVKIKYPEERVLVG